MGKDIDLELIEYYRDKYNELKNKINTIDTDKLQNALNNLATFNATDTSKVGKYLYVEYTKTIQQAIDIIKEMKE